MDQWHCEIMYQLKKLCYLHRFSARLWSTFPPALERSTHKSFCHYLSANLGLLIQDPEHNFGYWGLLRTYFSIERLISALECLVSWKQRQELRRRSVSS